MKENLDEIPLPPIEPEAEIVEMTPDGFERFVARFRTPPLSLVVVCAWHDPASWPKLEEGQAYTHGICQRHKEEMLSKIPPKKMV